MDEMLLHHIWKFQKFDHPTTLKTTDGRPIQVYHPGNHNKDSGPDFEEARIKIGTIEWAGHVEIHIRSSDWYQHHHDKDPSYDNVILHIVWKDDARVTLKNERVPTLELSGFVSEQFLINYQQFVDQDQPILCAQQLNSVSALTYHQMIERTAVERLEAKAVTVLDLLKSNSNDWDTTTYQLLLMTFGFNVNKSPFTQLSFDLPFSIVKKYVHTPLSMEALLLGQAGFLEHPVDEYQSELSEEYHYLKKKHDLFRVLQRHSWKFGRMRPPNFPTVRIAQVAGLLTKNVHIFQTLITTDAPALIQSFTIEVSDYWKHHYDFAKRRNQKAGKIGKKTVDNLIINAVSPLLAAYSGFTGQLSFMDQAIQYLEAIKPEVNKYTKLWKSLGRTATHGLDSQGQLELLHNYCFKKQCLNCGIGNQLLKK